MTRTPEEFQPGSQPLPADLEQEQSTPAIPGALPVPPLRKIRLRVVWHNISRIRYVVLRTSEEIVDLNSVDVRSQEDGATHYWIEDPRTEAIFILVDGEPHAAANRASLSASIWGELDEPLDSREDNADPGGRRLLSIAFRLGPVTPPSVEEHLDDSLWSEVRQITSPNIERSSEEALAFSVAPPPSPAVSAGVRLVRRRAAETRQAAYEVWYATNRRPVNLGNQQLRFSAERDESVHYGKCRVNVPAAHKIGSLGSPWWKRLLTMTDDRLRLAKTISLPSTEYWSAIAASMEKIPTNVRQAVVFIHGFNVSFEQAALRTAQIGVDLSIRGAMAFFSWPSQGQLDARAYEADEETIGWSENAIHEFLIDFANNSGADKVHIIAHSMGNRGLLRALDRLSSASHRVSGVPFGQIILAAADVDSGQFPAFFNAFARLAVRTTLYISTRDRAVEASAWLHKFPRAGLMPPVLVIPPMDTINVTNADLTLLGHGYVAEARSVLEDMHALINHDLPPDRRFGLKPVEGENYWLIGA